MAHLGPAVAALVVIAAMSGCAPAAPSAPNGVTASVYQPRPDVAAGRIAIQVQNAGTLPVEITGARLVSTYFTDALAWEGEREPVVAPGQSLDLRVQLADSDCAVDVKPVHTVVLDFRIGGSAGTVELVPEDPFELLPRLRDAACLEVRVNEIVDLTAVEVVADGTLGAPGEVVITVEPTGVEGSVTVIRAYGTTLLAPARDGIGVGELELSIRLDRDGPTEFRLPIVPNRCDPHALAEDKVGTRLPLEVSTSTSAEGRLTLAASDELRGQMYAFYSTYCGF